MYEQGRCKAYGVAWNEVELTAIHALKIPVDFVRNGITTLVEYNAELNKVQSQEIETGKKPIHYWTKAELLNEAKKLHVEVSDNEITRHELIHLIKVAQSKLTA